MSDQKIYTFIDWLNHVQEIPYYIIITPTKFKLQNINKLKLKKNG